MSLERFLQISLAVLAALSTVLLGMGEGSAVLPVAAIIIAAASPYLTDWYGWIRLSAAAADAGGVVAAIASFYAWQYDPSGTGLMALVNFVVYVQFVLQFKEKTIGTYWLLVVLSLMQVAVATALNEKLMFGFLLVAYVILALLVLVAFYLTRESMRARAEAERAEPWLAAWTPTARGLPRGAQAPLFVGHAPSLTVAEVLTRGLLRQLATIGGTMLLLATVLFYSIPRAEQATWTNAEDGDDTHHVVGFSNEVNLGELGDVSQSEEAVMRVRLTDEQTKETYLVTDEPLFRGVLLTTYSDKKWSRPQDIFQSDVMRSRLPTNLRTYVRQHVEMQPLNTTALFCIAPIFNLDESNGLSCDPAGEQIVRGRAPADRSFDFSVLTTGLRNHRQVRLLPRSAPPSEEELATLLALPPAVDGRDPLAGTKEIAQRIVADIPPESRLERARALEAYLRDSPQFKYSLEGVERDPALDPIEDFVTMRHLGNCEYFASALALMLRAVDVPARLAIGFKGGEWNESYYQVRALHAHAWVEAYLGPEHMAPTDPLGFVHENGAWLTLDPTTSSDAQMLVAGGNYLAYAYRQFVSFMRVTWSTYVLGLDYERQQEAVYQPLVNMVRDLADGEFWQAMFLTLAIWFSPEYWGLTNGGWFSWRGAMAAIVIMLLALAAWYAARMALRAVWRWAGRRAATLSEGRLAGVDFYRRLEALLAAHELHRTRSQTQREFALSVGGQMAESPHTQPAAAVPRHVADAFYRVRFGGQALDNEEAAAVEQALLELAGAFASGPPPGGRNGR